VYTDIQVPSYQVIYPTARDIAQAASSRALNVAKWENLLHFGGSGGIYSRAEHDETRYWIIVSAL